MLLFVEYVTTIKDSAKKMEKLENYIEKQQDGRLQFFVFIKQFVIPFDCIK